MKKSYSEKLKDPRWQKKRLEIMERDKWQCRACGAEKSTLNVHHTTYFPKCDPWDYPDILLITLCKDCHTQEHDGDKEKEIKGFISGLKDRGVLLSDISFLLESITEQEYTRSQITSLANNIQNSEKTQCLYALDKIKNFIKSIEI